MNERYNPFANMTQVPRSESVRNGNVGPAMEYTPAPQGDFFDPFSLIPQQNFSMPQEVYAPEGYNCMGSGVNYNDIQQMAFSALDEIDARNEVLAEREDPEILMAFQGVCSGIKHQDIQASIAPVVFSDRVDYIPTNNSEPPVFGYYNNFSKKEESVIEKKDVLDMVDKVIDNSEETINKLKSENIKLKEENTKLKAKLYEVLEGSKPLKYNIKSNIEKQYKNVGSLLRRVK